MNIEDIESADLDGVTDDELIQMYHSVDGRARQLSFAKFMIYNTVDNDLVEKIDDKKQFMQLAIAIAMLTKSKLSDSTGTVKIWDNLIYHMALTDKLVIPPKKHVDMVDNAGGYVREVTPGLYRWPVVFDLTSLYPCSLPHRQLRNARKGLRQDAESSLPHRQLRKFLRGPLPRR